jgi:hypothetical protein
MRSRHATDSNALGYLLHYLQQIYLDIFCNKHEKCVFYIGDDSCIKVDMIVYYIQLACRLLCNILGFHTVTREQWGTRSIGSRRFLGFHVLVFGWWWRLGFHVLVFGWWWCRAPPSLVADYIWSTVLNRPCHLLLEPRVDLYSWSYHYVVPGFVLLMASITH